MRKHIIFILIFMVALTGCTDKKENIYKEKETCTGFDEKINFSLKEKGWLHVMEISYNCANKVTYWYDAYNVKYQKLDGYYTEINYPDGTVEKTYDGYVSLALSKKQLPELKKINDFLNDKQYQNKITVKDIEALQLKELDSKAIVEVFNKTINTEKYTEFGPYIMEPFFKIKDVEEKDYKIQAAVLSGYGNMIFINIEIIYKNGTYLKDIIESKKATKKQVEIYKNIKQIENKIVQLNNIDVKQKFPNLKEDIYTKIFTFLQDYYKTM